jgi:hypothetical protein
VGAQRGRGGIQLLDAAMPELAAVVDDVVLLELLDPPLDSERVAAGRQAPALHRAEHAVGVGLEHRAVRV